MRLGKYLLVPWLTLAVYTMLSVYSGSAGIVPYRVLLGEKERILENLDKLQLINQELEGTMNALLTDSETVRIRARELGYGEHNERFVRIVGLPGGMPSNLRAGTIRTAVLPAAVSDKARRLIAFCIGLLLLGLFLTGDFCLFKNDCRDKYGR